MFQRRRRAITFIVAAGVAACASSTDVRDGAPAALTSLPRPLTSSEQSVSNAGNAFSISLFKQINAASPDSNIFISPLSASMALGMTLNGAAGATFDAMRSTLGFATTSQQSINAGYKGLIDLLADLDKGTTFQLANSIWYRQGFPIKQPFLDTVKTYFGAEVQGLDFSSPAAKDAINGWVNAKTNGKIPTIVDEISSDDVMFLINAIYFKGSWRQAFDPAETRDAPFHALGGATEPMKLMHGKGTLRVASGSNFSLAELPYGNGAWVMTVLLPGSGVDINQVAASLTAEEWASATARLTDAGFDVYLPKFRLSWERMLNPDLISLGMGVAFDAGVADFSHMSSESLFIEYVRQKTFVDVNEQGTEAAAVTGVAVGVTSMPPSIMIDRPFLFAIRERLSGTILFMGKVVHMPKT
jgi:serine protease inhibitor